MNTRKYVVVSHLTDKTRHENSFQKCFCYDVFISELSENHQLSSTAYSCLQLYERCHYACCAADVTGPAKGKPSAAPRFIRARH